MSDLQVIWDKQEIQVILELRADQDLQAIWALKVNLGLLVNKAHLGPMAHLVMQELRVQRDVMETQVAVGCKDRVDQEVMLDQLDLLEI